MYGCALVGVVHVCACGRLGVIGSSTRLITHACVYMRSLALMCARVLMSVSADTLVGLCACAHTRVRQRIALVCAREHASVRVLGR